MRRKRGVKGKRERRKRGNRRESGKEGRREKEERSEKSSAGLLIQHRCLLKPIRTGDSAGAMIDGK